MASKKAMSLDNLYQIVEARPDGATVRLNPDHPLYAGHFPGNPVTPGVVLMQMATEMLETNAGRRLQLRTVQNVKFRKPVGPAAIVSFVFGKVAEADGQLTAKVTIEDEGVQYARMSLLFDVIS